MSKIYKASNIFVDENNRVNINNFGKKLKNTTTEVKEVNEEINLKNEKKIEEENKYKKKYEEIIKKAKEEANSIISTANEEAIMLKEAESKRGYEEGFEQGKKSGFDEAKLEVEKENQFKLEEIEQQKEEVLQSKKTLEADLEKDIVDLVNNICLNVLNNALKLNKEMLNVLIIRGLQKATILDKVIIKVSEEDFENVNLEKESFSKTLDSSISIEIVKDFTLKKNDCILETEYGNINCGLNEQYNSIKENLYYILNND